MGEDKAKRWIAISIHVPLAGDDAGGIVCGDVHIISIHVPLAGDDEYAKLLGYRGEQFLSTSPLRGTT